jgi:hypothetical protein
MIGCWMPPIFVFPATFDTSIMTFSVTEPSACTCGVTSMFTPTSRYWNCVFTSGLMPTPPMPGWNEPVATGTRSPIFSEAFWPSTARICGCCTMRLSLSLYSAVAVAELMFTWKSVAFRLPSAFRLMLPGDPVVPVVPVVVPVVPVVVLLVLRFGCSETVALVGGLIPRVRIFSRFTCITAMSTTTSGLALSMSLISFSAPPGRASPAPRWRFATAAAGFG